jgi:DNA-binding transcriptional regulator YhcF (GntR family)
MKQSSPVCRFINIDFYSATPKYLQLANCVMKAIREKKVNANEILPSINELSFEFEISRDTAEKGYKYLKSLGILGSVPGKGYFIKSVDINQSLKIFLLFNKLSAHKKIIYDSFVSSLGDMATVDFYIYNNDYLLFKKLLSNKKEEYSHYVIIPHFLEGGQNAHEIINTIPKDKLLLMDKLIDGVDGCYAAVFEDFEKDIYHALEQALPALSKYETLKIIFPSYTYHPEEILRGFCTFCDEYAFNYKVINNIKKEPIKKREAYINLMEDDLVALIEKVIADELEIGKDVGIISYNETPLKKFILNGITTISTDFELMGRKTAELILNHSTEHIAIPFYLTLRPSL